MGAAKALNFVNLLFAILVWALAVVALNGVNYRKQAVTTSCMQYCTGNTGSGDQEISIYLNLWGLCTTTKNPDEYTPETITWIVRISNTTILL